MSRAAAITMTGPVRLPAAIGLLQRALLWLLGAAGGLVLIEPSPYEGIILAAIFIFMSTGLRLRAGFVPLMAMLFIVNLGYTICATPLMGDPRIVTWILTSWYLAISAIFFAAVIKDETELRLGALRGGLVAGGVLTSLLGIVGYFHLVPGNPEAFTLYTRAAGGFKDPNVFGAYLILPAMFSLQSVLLDRPRKATLHGLCLLIMALAVTLSFSRAAWGQLVFTSMALPLLLFFTSGSVAQRGRILILMVVGAGVAALGLAVLLSIDKVYDLFTQRAALEQSYDAGRFGRFGRYVLGAEMALDLPFGIGPLQFNRYFPEDTHNSYLNAFMSGGWISGICYPALIFSTFMAGARTVVIRTPWQRMHIAVFVVFTATAIESFIIDTDHWRHYFMMIGLIWGLAVAAWQFVAQGREV
jgi:hypothetical protein